MRRFVAGAAMAAACWATGCKDNPGFGLIPAGSTGEPSTMATGPGSTAPIDGTTTTTTTGTTTTAPVTDTTAVVTSSTTDPPETSSSGNTEPPPDCGNGMLDDGEACDDGNTLPGDGCEANCRPLFELGPMKKFGEVCTFLSAAPFDPDDQLSDLALARGNSGPITVLRNTGLGVFIDEAKDFNVEQPGRVHVARNIDGSFGPDMVVLEEDFKIAVCPNKDIAVENYCNGPLIELLTGGNLLDILLIADVDGALGLDILVASQAELQVGYFPGKNDGTFLAPVTDPLPDTKITGQIQAMALASVDGIKTLDLVVAHDDQGTGRITIVPNFATSNDLPSGPHLVGSSAKALAVADLGLHGDFPEIVVADPVETKLWLLSDARGGYSVQGDGIAVGQSPTKVLAAPLRGVGTWDLVTFERDGSQLHVAAVVVDGGPIMAAPYDTEVDGLVDFVVADLDGDGDPDIAAIDGDCNLRIMFNQTKVP